MSNSSRLALAWCLTWSADADNLESLHTALVTGLELNDAAFPRHDAFQSALEQVTQLDTLKHPTTKAALIEQISQPPYNTLKDQKIGLVYGGVTKVKSYVFESADLQEIRGASGLLDRINLIDLPAFFHAERLPSLNSQVAEPPYLPACREAATYCQSVRQSWLEAEFPGLSKALIPQLIVYATGGNILAFCPAAVVDQLANAIEKRYTVETLTANSCAVGDCFSPLEIRLGLLRPNVEQTLWQDEIAATSNPAVQAYFDLGKKDVGTAFRQRKSFSELAGKLANQFNQRRAGYDLPNAERPSRGYPPMFETHPYLQRDDVERRSAVAQIRDTRLPDSPKLSEASARKRRVGQITKREGANEQNWYRQAGFEQHWDPNPLSEVTSERPFQSWVSKFETFLRTHTLVTGYDPDGRIFNEDESIREIHKREARALNEIGDASKGYVAYIYADGNNMGQYIRNEIGTPAAYRQFSQDVFDATERSVYYALAECIHPHYYRPDARSPRTNTDPVYIHPFEIVAIGGDDVLLIVPANKALEIALKIGQHFERIITETGRYPVPQSDAPVSLSKVHRYRPDTATPSTCQLSISSGVLITAANTPIYYADRLVSQLLKSAKKKAKPLKKDHNYYGGTVDILTLKAVTMISSNIDAFREDGLTVTRPVQPDGTRQELKLHATPYTLHELDGLITTIHSVKRAGFPRSQLYQIRSLLERGKRTAILNYRYFRVRLEQRNQDILKDEFETPWCAAKTNDGNLAPWLPPAEKDPDQPPPQPDKTIYETLWRELVELYEFVEPKDDPSDTRSDRAPERTGGTA